MGIPKVHAEGNSVSVTPSIRQLDLKEDQPEYTISYKNNTAETVELNFNPTDFSELEDGWKIKFLEPKDANQYKYSLSSWIELNRKSLILEPGEKADLEVKVLADRLSPGGHYGSILAQISTNDRQNKQISLKGTISSLLFVRTNTGREILSAEVFSLISKSNWWNFPELFSLKIRNTGNTQLSPFGNLTVTDPFNKIVAKSILNEGSYIILPETIRGFDLKLAPKTAFLWPGIYRVELSYHLGSDPNPKIYNSTFFSLGNLGPVLLGAILLILIAIRIVSKKLKRK